MSGETNELGAGDYARLSVAMRQGLIDYDLRPTERDLAGLLVLETFDKHRVRAEVRIDSWAKRLGWRADKLERLAFRPLVEFGLVDLNAAQGTFELRPNVEAWSRVRALRIRPRPDTDDVLPLSAERPLDEALSSWSREQALEKAPIGTRIHSAEKSATERRKNPPSSDCEEIHSFGGLEEKSSGVQQLAAAAIRPSLKAAAASCSEEKSAQALAWLQSIDERGMLRVPAFSCQWLKLCSEHPDWVLGRAKRRCNEVQPQNALGFLSRMARDEGIMRAVD